MVPQYCPGDCPGGGGGTELSVTGPCMNHNPGPAYGHVHYVIQNSLVVQLEEGACSCPGKGRKAGGEGEVVAGHAAVGQLLLVVVEGQGPADNTAQEHRPRRSCSLGGATAAPGLSQSIWEAGRILTVQRHSQPWLLTVV